MGSIDAAGGSGGEVDRLTSPPGDPDPPPSLAVYLEPMTPGAPDHSDDDLSLFRSETGDVSPIEQDRAEPYRKRPSPRPQKRAAPPPPESPPQNQTAETEIETGDLLEFVRPGIQHRLFRELRRGRIKAGAELDLHGMTVAVAGKELTRFLHRCHGERIRCVRLIHGKGRSSADKPPVLKRKINHWLRQWEKVLAFCSAPPRDGGTGATYVLLSQKRKSDQEA